MIKPTENFDAQFWDYNYPVQLWRDEQTGDTSYVTYSPRKGTCWNSQNDSETIPKEELIQFCDNSIEKFKEAIRLFEKFKNGETDVVYYWDRDSEKSK